MTPWLDRTHARCPSHATPRVSGFQKGPLPADAGLAREAEAWDRRRIPVAIPTGIDDDSATMRLVRALYGAAAAIEIDKADTVWRAWVKIRPGAESGSVYGENSTPEGACSVLVKRLRAGARRRIVKLRLEARELANAANAAKAANDARW